MALRQQPDRLIMSCRAGVDARPIPLLQFTNAQMISHMRHGSPPRLMALLSKCFVRSWESRPSQLPGIRITRFVVCRLNNENSCSHHALLENFGLRYDAPLTEGDTLDGKLASLVESWRVKTSSAPKTSACGYLADLIDKASPGPLFLPSYPTVESGPLHGAAYLYDNAVAAIALVGCGERDRAYRIGAAILWAIDNDRTWHDGRLRNAYAAGVVANGPVKLPGWWDNTL